MITLEFDEAVSLLKRAIEEKGADYVYNMPGEVNASCVYFFAGKPSCIVGHVLAYKGMTQEEIGEDNIGSGVYSLANNGIIEVDEVTRDFLLQVQESQDTGIPWGESLQDGIEYVKCLGVEVTND